MIHLDPRSYRNDRIFLELRFKESFKLALNDTKYIILDKLQKKYPAYNIENPENISLVNHERGEQVAIQLNRLFFSWDKPKSITDFIKSVQPDCNFILKTLEVDDILRIGFRTHNSFQGSSQNSINEFIYNNYLSRKFKSSDFADQFFNPVVQFSGKKGSLTFNIVLTYSQEQIIEHQIGQTAAVSSQIRDLLMVDLDTYKEKIRTNKLQNFFQDSQQLNSKLCEYILSIKE
jgi:hypothetical protein